MAHRFRRLLVVLLAIYALWLTNHYWYDFWQRRYSQVNYEFYSHLTLHDFLTIGREPKPIGIVSGDPLSRLGVGAADLDPPAGARGLRLPARSAA